MNSEFISTRTLRLALFGAALTLACGTLKNDRSAHRDGASGAAGEHAAGGGNGENGGSGHDGSAGTAAEPEAGDSNAGGGSAQGGRTAVGGSASRGGTAGSTSIPESCAEFARTTCAAFFECDPHRAAIQYGSNDVCAERITELCDAMERDGVTLDHAGCAFAVNAAECMGFYGGTLPAVCTLPLGDGVLQAECSSDADCASGYCDIKGECGRCGERRPEREGCFAREDCVVGLICDGGECRPARPTGASCTELWHCGPADTCLAGVCTDKAGPGSDCDDFDACVSGSACVGAKCQTMPLLKEGAECGTSPSECADRTECYAPNAPELGHCRNLPELGAPCSGGCAAPFLCVDGICAYRLAPGCGAD